MNVPRLRPTFLLVVCLVVTRGGWASADEEDASTHLLRYRFAAGEVLRYEVSHTANIRNTIDGTTQSAETESKSTKLWKVIDVMPTGEIEFVHVVEAVRMSNQLPNRAAVVYDSREDEVPPPGYEGAAKAVGVPLSVIRMTAAGQIVKRERKHQQPSDDDRMPITIPLPAEPVAVGARWDEPHEVVVPTEGNSRKKIETRRRFELLGVSHGIAKIAVSYQILSPINARVEAQLVQKLSDGHVWFDIDRGRVVRQRLAVDKRIVGFHGPSSSMHYTMDFEERLADAAEEVAHQRR